MVSFASWLLILLAVLLIPTMIVGLISPAKLAAKGSPAPSRKKIVGFSTLWFFILSGVGLSLQPETEQAKQPEPASQPQIEAAATTKETPEADQATAASDLRKLTDYHKQVVRLSNEIADADGDARAAFSSKTPDQFKMYEAANNSFSLYSLAYRSAPPAPDFSDKSLKDDAEKMSQAFKNSLFLRVNAFDKLRKAIDDGQFKPSTMSQIKEATDQAKALEAVFAIQIFTLYNHFKIPLDKIDLENGGFKE